MGKISKSIVVAAFALALMPLSAFAASPDFVSADVSQLSTANQGATLETQAKTDKKATKKMRAAYKKVLKKAQLGQGVFSKVYSSTRAWMAHYTMRDVNKDGTPELFVYAGTCTANAKLYAFTIKSGKAKYIGKFGDGNTSLYSGKGKAVYGQSGHMGVMRIYRATLSGGKLKAKMVLSDSAELQRFPKATKYSKSHKLKLLNNSEISNYTTLNKAKVKK